VVDLEFDRAVFGSPFAVEVAVAQRRLGRRAKGCSPGQLDGFLDDGVVLDDTRDVDRRRRHVGIGKSFERRVYTCGE
jgi:hypothetical protein